MKRTQLVWFVVITAILFFFASEDLQAVIAYPYPIQYRQPDGTTITVRLKGDERLSWAETTDGYTLLNNGKKGWEYAVLDGNKNMVRSGRMAHNADARKTDESRFLSAISAGIRYSREQVSLSRASLKSTAEIAGFTPTGTKKLLLILVQYPDKQFAFTQSDFANLMNTPGYTGNGAQGSLRDYFLENSYGAFDLTTDVAPHIYTSRYNMAYYGEDEGTDHSPRASDLVKEAVLAADADGVDFSQYDNDSDGKVDGVYVIYAGYGQASGGGTETIWPHAGGISGVTCDGVAVTSYSCSNELTYPTNAITTIGVICHEFGHVCGAPDYYDTNYDTGGQFPGTGEWDLMDTGLYNGSPSGSLPSHMNPFEKVEAGWITPVTLSVPTSLSIPDVTANPVVYIYNTTTPNEFFMVENRQQTGFNTDCPGHGLLVYHYSQTYWNISANKTYPQGFYPVCASSTTNPTTTSNAASYGSINTSGCPFPGSSAKTSFTDDTTPWARSWAGNTTGSPLTNITESGGIISLCFKGCPGVNPVTVFNAIGLNSSQIGLTWNKNSSNDDVIIAWNTSATFGNLTDGTVYNVNDVLSGGGTVVYKGSLTNFTHSSLSPSTTYYYRIWAFNHSNNYSEALPASAVTECASLVFNMFTEGFEGGAIPSCWDQEFIKESVAWDIKTQGVNGHPASPHSGSYLVRMRDLNWDYPVTKLVTCPLNLSGASTPVLKFWHTQEAWDSNQDVLRVYYRTAAISAWVLLATYTGSIASWTMETISLPNPSSAYYIAFEANIGNAYGVCLDDIEIWKNDCTVNTWTGAESRDWFSPSNWSCGVIPMITTDISIPAGMSNYPLISVTGAVCRTLTVSTGAVLEMNSSGTSELTVSGNVTINGTFTAGAGTLNLTGDWTMNGAFNCGTGTVNFNGANVLQTIGGSSASTFYILMISKGERDRIVEAVSQIGFTSHTIDHIQYSVGGTFKLSSPAVITPFTTNGYTLQPDYGIWNNGGTITLPSTIFNGGLIRNTLGVLNSGYLCYSWSDGELIIEGGTVNVNYRLYPYTIGSDVLKYTQTGGTLNVPVVSSSSTSFAPFDLREGSTFNLSGGTIAIKRASSYSAEYLNFAETHTVTGGTLQIGNAETTGSPTIRINSTVPVHNLVINGTGTPKGQLVTNNLTVNNAVTINSGGVLLGNGLTLTAGGNWTNNGTFTHNNGTVNFNGINPQIINGNAESVFNNLTVGSGGAVATIASGAKVTVSGALATNNLLTINSEITGSTLQPSGSLIYSGSGTPSGTVTYNRRFLTYPVGSGSSDYDWHYFSSPVMGQPVSGFNPDKVTAIWQWSEDNATPWQMVSSGNFESGKGYNLDQSAASDGLLPFTGTIATTVSPLVATAPYNTYSTDYTNQRGTWGGGGWNLLGNPFTSAMDAAAFVTANTASFDPSYQAVYIYDGSSGSSGNYYVISGGGFTDPFGYGAFSSTSIQAGQGFFVLAKQNGVQFTFSRNWQVHGTTVPLKSAELDSPWAGLRLNVRKGQDESSTTILYREGMSAGLDPGYDLGLLSTQPEVEVYTALVRNNGVNFIRQALPLSRAEKYVVPVGIDCEQGGQVTFSAEILPMDGVHFMLEDRENGNWTNLKESSYTTVLKSKTSGTGRFYLQAVPVSTALKPDAGRSNEMTVWTSGSEIHINGNFGKQASALVYDLSGRKILENQLTGTASNVLFMPSGARGIYLVKVTDGLRLHTAKVVF